MGHSRRIEPTGKKPAEKSPGFASPQAHSTLAAQQIASLETSSSQYFAFLLCDSSIAYA
jgi:hypothetical protein